MAELHRAFPLSLQGGLHTGEKVKSTDPPKGCFCGELAEVEDPSGSQQEGLESWGPDVTRPQSVQRVS